MPPPAPDAKIAVTTLAELNQHFAQLRIDLSIPETEDSWQKLDRALARLQAITKGGATKFHEYIPLLKQLSQPINNSLLSERTRLSGTAGDLINSVAPRLVERFDALVSIFVPTLLAICARTNRVAVKRAEKSLLLICKHCKLASLVPLLRGAAADKSQGLRAVAVGCMLALLESTEKAKLSRRISDIEAVIKGGATDSHPEVRQVSKKVFELYIAVWPERVASFTKPLTPTIRRYLSLPKTGALVVEVPEETEEPTEIVSAAPSRSASSSSSSLRQSQRAGTAPEPRQPAPSAVRSEVYRERTQTLEPATGLGPSTAKRSLFADQLAAVRAQHKTSRCTQPQDSASSAMRAPPPMDGYRPERTRERESSSIAPQPSASRRPHWFVEEPEPPTIGADLRASISASASARNSKAPTSASGPPPSSSSARAHKNPLSASFGPSSSSSASSTSSKHLSSSMSGSGSISAFAAASGLHGSSKMLAAYAQAFTKDHLRAASHPDLGSLVAATARNDEGEQASAGRSRQWAEKPVPSRSKSDDAPSSDAFVHRLRREESIEFEQPPASAQQHADLGRTAPSDGVAERLVQAQQSQMEKVHDPTPSSERRTESSTFSRSTTAGDGSQPSAKATIKASRVQVARPAAPAKASAVRVARPAPTPSASRTSALRASTNSSMSSTPAPTPSARGAQTSSTAAAASSTQGEERDASASSGKRKAAPEAVPKVSSTSKSTTSAASAPKPQSSTATTSKTSTVAAAPSKPRVVVVSTAPGKKFQPKPLAARGEAQARTKVTSSISASLAPKSKLVGASAGATDKAVLVKKAGQQARVASFGSKTEHQKGEQKGKKEVPRPLAPTQARSAQQGQAKPAPREAAHAKAAATPSTPSKAAHRADKASVSADGGTLGKREAEARDGDGGKRTPFGARDTNVVQSSPIPAAGHSTSAQKAKDAAKMGTKATSSPSARIAAALRREAQQMQARHAAVSADVDTTGDASSDEEDDDEAGVVAAIRRYKTAATKDGDDEAVQRVMSKRQGGGMQLVLGGSDASSDAETVVVAAATD